MNCRAAQRLLFDERKRALGSSERAELETHVAGCAVCQRAQTAVAGAIDDWRATTARVEVPDAERAWQDIRRDLRSASSSESRRTLRWAIPIGAVAAAVVAVFTIMPQSSEEMAPATIARAEKARADFVEVPGDASSVVYVDDKSGWLVVWSVDEKPATEI